MKRGRELIAKFKDHQSEILALYDSVPEIDPNYRREAKDYLEEYFNNMEVRVFWGKAQDFLTELARQRAKRNGA